MLRVFISYAYADQSVAKRISDQLTKAKLDNWLYDRDLQPGDNWQVKIEEALRDSTHCIFILSSTSLKSPAVTGEWQYFLAHNKRLLIAQVEAVEPEEVPWRLATIQRADLTHDFTKGVRSLIEAIRSEDALITERSASDAKRASRSQTSVTLEFDMKDFDSQKLAELIAELTDKGINDIRVVQVAER